MLRIPMTTTRETISWEELDKLSTAVEIAERLIEAGITGFRQSSGECPLARATGWWVSERFRRKGAPDRKVRLTMPEESFVMNFDDGDYPELIDPEELK